MGNWMWLVVFKAYDDFYRAERSENNSGVMGVSELKWHKNKRTSDNAYRANRAMAR